MEEPKFQPIVTLYDAVTDSPVFRSSVQHYDQQLEHLENWLDSLARQLKLYTEKLNKLNTETIIVAQKAIPDGIDETLIDPSFTGAVMKSFSDALQTSLSFKAKLISNLEEALVSPLQQFVKTHLRDFKNFRKEHEKALERYEAQLAKYSALHKTKEPSAIREEAFRLHEARKEYVRMSGQHVLRILNFRSLLEHCLVERFSSATVAHKVFYDDIQVWAKLEVALSYWKQWLMDDKSTCSYQLHKQQIARKKLEDEYFRLTAPDYDIGKYMPNKAGEKSDSHFAKSKWGYLFIKVSKHSWSRKWFFIHSGYLGMCQMDNTNKHKASISIENRIRVADYEVRAAEDTDRRFCFEIINAQSQTAYILQAETEASMQEWIDMFQRNKTDGVSSPTRSIKIKSKSNATTAISSSNTTTTTEVIPESPKSGRSDSSSFSHISSISENNKIPNISSASLNLSRNYSQEGSSIVMVSTTPDADASLENSSSLTPLLVWEASCASNTTYQPLPSASWGIPWSLVPTMIDLHDTHNGATEKAPVFPKVIWPAKPATIEIPKVEINGYTDKMNAQNKELRRLFGGVKPEEIVLAVFGCCLRSKPMASDGSSIKEIESSKSALNSNSAELYEKELVNQLSHSGLKPLSDFGYSYAGRGFITQETFWFYSSVLMSCINTVAIRLKDIDQVEIIKDNSLSKYADPSALAAKSDMAISITLIPDQKSDVREPLIFGTLMDDIEATAEKLRFAVSNAKSDDPMQIRNIFNKMQNLSSMSLVSKKSLVLDLPSTFSDAVKPVDKSKNVIAGPKRPHAATVGQESKVSTSSILKASNRLRGDSEPIKASTIKDQPKKKVVLEKPKPYIDPDVPPSHIHVPDGPVDCNCDDHLERQDAQMILPISAKRCYEMLFSNEQTAPPTNGGVWEEKTAAIEGHDLSVSKWAMTDGKMQRVLKYWMPVSNPIVRMKEAEVVETQILINKEDYIRYTVQISTKTAALPYADAFIPSVRYCITWIDQSSCQLTCYLGVRWVKSVLVRAIVTRAALKGMSDSVGVFVPILQSAADNLKAFLDEDRRKHNALQNAPDVSASIQSGMESLVEEDGGGEESMKLVEEKKEIIDYSQPNKAVVAPISSTTSVKSVTPSPSVSASTTPSPSKSAQSSAGVVSTKQSPEKARLTVPTPARSVSPSSPAPKRSKIVKHSVSHEESSWLAKISDFLPISMVSVGFLLLLGFTIYMTFSWYNSETKVINKANNYPRINGSENHPSMKKVPIAKQSNSRSVYLRDLNEGFLKNSLLPPYAGSISYKTFLSVKDEESKGLESGELDHTWYHVDHYQLALDLDISRERIAMLRHDMLLIFQVLNRVDSQLVESEYMNWLLDFKLKCKYTPRFPESDPRSEKSMVLCQDIKRQLDRLF